jgi:uncharacterized protein YecE (DUF72 family)
MVHEKTDTSKLFIGPAGWSYRDWVGPVYPPSGKIDRLLFIARFFNCIELNSSFYRVPSSALVSSWRDRLSPFRGFRFTVKVWSRFTHDMAGSHDEARSFIDRFEPLITAERIGAFLLQFPWSFRNNTENRKHIEHLGRWFSSVPAAVELRHGSWNVPSTWELLSGAELAFCNIDQPLVGDSLPATEQVTNSRIAYIRLHGRNRRNWFRKDAGRDERYDYCYGDEELEEWKDRSLRMLGRVDRLFIVTNNHFMGQAVANAFQLKHLLEEKRLKMPETVRRAYPTLDRFALPSLEQGDLLDDGQDIPL